jgi:hypothetical protein
MATPNMALVLPTNHGSADTWDTILATVFGLIDAHDHTTGKGVQVPSLGLKINADVPWTYGGTSYAITSLLAAAFTPSPAAGVASYTSAMFVNSADGELYWRTAGGSNVKMTSGTALNVVAFSGGIGGDYSAVGALASFDDASDSYWLQQQGSPRPWAGLRVGNLDIYQQAASIVNRVRISSPSALAASYAITLPAALPGSTVALQLSAAGQLTASNTFATSPKFTTAETLHISACDAQTATGGPTFATSGNGWTLGTSTQRIVYPLRLPRDAQINAWRIIIRKISAAGTITGQLYKYDASSLTETAVGAAATYPASSGYTVLQVTGLTENISTQAVSYYLALTGGGTTGDAAYHAELDYTRP